MLRKGSKISKDILLGRSRFSSRQLVVFALIFAAIGGYVIYKSIAAAPWNPDSQFTFYSGDDWAHAAAASGSTIHFVHGSGEVLYRRSVDQGATWTADTLLANGWVHPTDMVAAQGNDVWVTYLDQINFANDSCCNRRLGRLNIRHSTNGGVSWGPSIPLSASSAAFRISVAVSGSTVHVVWMDYRDGDWDMYYRRSLDGGTTWQPEQRLVQTTVPGEGASRPQIAVVGSSVHIAYWINGPILYLRSLDGGTTWDPPKAVTGSGSLKIRPDIAASGSNIVIAYDDDVVGTNELYTVRSTDNGVNWGAAQRMTNAAGLSEHVTLAASGSSIHMAWADNRDGNNEIYYRLSNDAGATWGAEERVTQAAGDSNEPSIAIASSYVHATWTDDRTGPIQIWQARRPLLTADTTPPTVSLTAPAAGATVSGAAVTLSATAADNVGVAGVQFKLDGTNIGSEDTTSPYSISWNSTSTSNGSHNLSATARDAAGNATTSAAINVTVSNGVTPPPPTGSVTANVALKTTGNNTTCTRSSSLVDPNTLIACATWERACQVATAGDKVAVYGGQYNQISVARYLESDCTDGGASNVSFICGPGVADYSVTHNSRDFTIKSDKVTISGKCFEFQNLKLGEGGDTNSADSIIIDGVHMASFSVWGTENSTFRRNEIGPTVACYGPNDTNVPPNTTSAMRCSPTGPWPEDRCYIYGGCTDETSGQAQIRCVSFCNSQATNTYNFLLEDNWFHDFQSKDGRPEGLHPGCLQYYANGSIQFTMRRNILENCASQAILFEWETGVSNVTIENNWVGPAIEPYSSGLGCCTPATASQDGTSMGFKNAFDNANNSNWLVRYNTTRGFGWSGTNASYTNVRLIGNLFRTTQFCPAGVTWNYNASEDNGCGTNKITALNFGASVADNTGPTSLQVRGGTPGINFHLSTGTKTFENWVTPTTSDYTLSTDYDGQTRSSPLTAGSDERDSGSPPPPPPPTKPGDLNNDNAVNIFDLSILLSNYNTTNAVADINKDGTVNVQDLSILLSNYGT